jgi:hypothetical protein
VVKHNRLAADVVTPFANAGAIVKYWILENTVITGARVAGEKMSEYFVHASSNAAQTLTDAVETALTFNTEQWDDDAMHSTVSATDTFTIPTGGAGVWDIHCSCWFAAVNTTGTSNAGDLQEQRAGDSLLRHMGQEPERDSSKPPRDARADSVC